MSSTSGPGSRPRGRAAATAITSIVLSALLGAVIKDLWEAPRPHVEVSSVSLGLPPGSETLRVDIGETLVNRSESHPFIKTLEASETVASLQGVIENAPRAEADYRALVARIDRLETLVKTQNAVGRRQEDLRVEFLRVWHEGPGSVLLDNLIQGIVMEPTLARARDPKYNRHPPGMEAADDIDLGIMRIVVREVRPLPTMAPMELYLTAATNVMRRLWIYYEPQVLIDHLSAGRKRVQEWLDDLPALIKDIKTAMEAAVPRRIVVTATASNRGRLPLTLRGVGVLKLSLPEGGAPLLVELSAEDPEQIVVVKGGEAEVLRLTSVNTLPQLLKASPQASGTWREGQDPEASRLAKLFEAEGGLKASLSLSRAGVSAKNARIGPSSLEEVGKPSRLALIKELEKE